MLALALAALNLAPSKIDPTLAARYFQEAEWISQDDGAKLWGKELYGPMIFVDPTTREAVANLQPSAATFRKDGTVFLGSLPPEVPIANYALKWGDRRWTMVLWPLPENRADRCTLMAHELFHRIQPEIGLRLSGGQNAHMETAVGRTWLQLEFLALAKALQVTEMKARESAIRDALEFRSARRKAFPAAAVEEDGLELNEGLATYTGLMMRGGFVPESRWWLSNNLGQMSGKDNYSRQFGYWTGSAYAFLLDLLQKDDDKSWRNGVANLASLSDAVARAVVFEASSDPVRIAKGYGYERIEAAEADREKLYKEKVERIITKYFDGPHLELPFENQKISFDNRTIVQLGEKGTYYGTATVVADWGRMEVIGGMVVSSDWKSARVTAPATVDSIEGEGWKMTLAPGWKIVAGTRKGDFRLARAYSLMNHS